MGHGAWNVRGRTCVVTGATSGIGEETARALAARGARLVLIARSPERAAATRDRIRGETPGAEVELRFADLSRQDEIRRVAGEVLAACPELHVLVNNAGVVNLRRETTADGLEATFAVNHLAYFLLTHLLLGRLRASAPARIVNVASDAHRFGRLDMGDLQSERRYRSMQVYGRSKTANILFTRELSRRLEGSGVTVNCLHPGAVRTGLGQQNGTLARALTSLAGRFFLSPAEGAETSIWLATDPEASIWNGGYFRRRRPHAAAPHARDDAIAARLWEASERLTGLAP